MNPRAAITKTLSTTRRLTRDYKVTLSLFIFIAGLAWLVSETPKNSIRLLDDIILATALILIVLGAGIAYTVISAERANVKDQKKASKIAVAADSSSAVKSGEETC